MRRDFPLGAFRRSFVQRRAGIRATRLAILIAPVVAATGAFLLAAHPALAACAPSNSTQPVGSCPSAPALAPLLGHSSETLDISNLFWFILAESGVVFALVMLALFLNMTRFSHKPGHDEEPKQIYGNRRIEIAWTLVPAVILLVAFVATVVVMNQVDAPADAALLNSPQPLSHPRAIVLNAIGHQWWWEFRLPAYHVVTANEVHVPVNTLIEVKVNSVDVIHSFWVPQLSRQIDATPNNNTIVYIDANHTGTYAGACYEFCGQGHAWMQFRFVVDSMPTFVKWATHEAGLPESPASQPALQGEQIFFGQSCGSCHTINGTPANGTAAPNLTHVGRRWAIGGGVLVMSELNLERWIHDPNHWKEGVKMPAFSFDPQQLHELAAYLYGLK